MKTRSKYGNRETVVDGIRFDSAKEARRWAELKLLEKTGWISDLRRQVPYELVPAIRKEDGSVQRAVDYIADFTYRDNGKFIVEDAKGYRTREYVLKKKLMLWRYGIEIRET